MRFYASGRAYESRRPIDAADLPVVIRGVALARFGRGPPRTPNTTGANLGGDERGPGWVRGGERKIGDDSRAVLHRAAEMSAGLRSSGRRLPRPRPSLRRRQGKPPLREPAPLRLQSTSTRPAGVRRHPQSTANSSRCHARCHEDSPNHDESDSSMDDPK